MASVAEIKKRLKAKLTEAPPTGAAAKGRIQALIDEVEKQHKMLDAMKSAKTAKEQKEKLVAQASWVKVIDFNDFKIKIGRAGYPYYGEENKYFEAKSIDEAKAIVDDIHDLVVGDADLQKVIKDYVAPPKKSTKG
jgi:hypothetical protein